METEPSPADEARRLVGAAGVATLSTLAVDPPGHPFGSLAPFALDERRNPLLCLSSLAEHTRNLRADPRASLLVVEEADSAAMARGRVTLLGRARCLERGAADDDSARTTWLAAHPDATYAHFADFSMWVLEVSHVRWIAGFGRMAWCDAADWSA